MKKTLIILTMLCSVFSFANVLEKAKALKIIPSDTWVAVMASNLDDLTLRLGKEDIINKYSDVYNAMVGEVTKVTGANLFTPEGLAQKGIDITKPCGFVVFDAEKEYLGFTVTLNDKELFRNFVMEISEKQGDKLGIEKVGDAELIYPNNGSFKSGMALRDDQMIFFIADRYRYRKMALEFLKGLAATKTEDSLAGNATFQESVSSLNFGKDFGVYVNIDTILKKSPLGGNQELIEQMSGKPALAIGAELHSNSLQFKSYFHMSKSAVLGTYVQDSHVPNLLFALNESPLMYFSTALDIPSLMESLSSFAPPQQMEEANQQAQGMFGMSFTELVTLFTGEMGFAITGNVDMANFTPDSLKEINGSVNIGITNHEKVQGLLDKMIEMQMFPIPVQKEDGVYKIATPEWKPVSVAITNDHIVISSDQNVIDNMQNGVNGNVTNQLVQLSSPTSIFSLDAKVFGYFLLYSVMGKHSDYATSAKESVSATAKVADNSGVPFSEEYLAKQKELEELRAAKEKALNDLRDAHENKLEQLRNETNKLNSELEQKTTKIAMDIIGRLGHVTLVSHKTSTGVRMSGGLFITVDAKQFAMNMFDDIMAISQIEQQRSQNRRQRWQKEDQYYSEYRKNRDSTREEYNAKEYKLEDELRQIRNKDVENHLNKDK
ncbi:hypothetical protein [Candidatus Uabimicrobium amorphum]|uniref:Uncharacterized protein n=1 Tax=Uabimicrobium amorphum TaxID=2596890 RepID=A0A5S9IPS6_UABAM|nr:hypothetical protein [Candidatus Uabimicrobium amorphum]BBM85376.1 hypothetical protein UABAM_03742 [Candidatus Uabimicrobium amorphum]